MKTICREQDFAYFRERCKHWIIQYRLTNWDFAFVFNRKEKLAKDLAKVTINFPARHAKIELVRDWLKTEVSKRALDATAFHEVMHVLLAPLSEAAEGPDEVDEHVREKEHSIIRNMIAAQFLPKRSVFQFAKGDDLDVV